MEVRNIKLFVSYDGTGYNGWQRIPGKRTIQGVIEEALWKILGEEIRLIGAGRTDAGAHALYQVANFYTKNTKIPEKNLLKALNSILPPDIRVWKVEETEKEFHARFSAKARKYLYIINNNTHLSLFPFIYRYTYYYPYEIDINFLREAVKPIIGTHDFKGFCTSLSKGKNTIRTIHYVSIGRWKGLILVFIKGDAFLSGMVRSIITALLQAFKEKDKEFLKKVLLERDRGLIEGMVPPQGLVLKKVFY